MFSALKFVAAGVIVALFGGFLLAGVLTAPQGDEVALPAAVTESPSPTTTAESLSGMVTEEVEPGILRVINDGVRDLGAPGGSWGQHGGVTIGADGTVWIHAASGRYFRVGREPMRDLPQEFRHVGNSPQSTFGADVLHAGPTGQLWARDERLGRVYAWLRDEWLERADMALDSMAIDGDNDAWGASRWGLLHVDTEGETLIGWPDDPTGQVAPLTLDVSAAGSPHVLSGPDDGSLDTLLRHDGSAWVETTLPAPLYVFFPGDGMGVGADGTVWVAGDDHGDTDYMHHSLARLDGSEWTVFTTADGVRPWGGKEGFVPEESISVSTDGSVWVDASTLDEGWWAECDGVARFDGTSWSQYLPRHCLVDIDFAPDGSAWVLTRVGVSGRVDLYVITPEVVAAVE